MESVVNPYLQRHQQARGLTHPLPAAVTTRRGTSRQPNPVNPIHPIAHSTGDIESQFQVPQRFSRPRNKRSSHHLTLPTTAHAHPPTRRQDDNPLHIRGIHAIQPLQRNRQNRTTLPNPSSSWRARTRHEHHNEASAAGLDGAKLVGYQVQCVYYILATARSSLGGREEKVGGVLVSCSKLMMG